MSHGPLPDILSEQMTPLVEQLLQIIQELREEIRQLREDNDRRSKPLKETRVVEPENIPESSWFKGYKKYTIQDLVVQATEITLLAMTLRQQAQLARAKCS